MSTTYVTHADLDKLYKKIIGEVNDALTKMQTNMRQHVADRIAQHTNLEQATAVPPPDSMALTTIQDLRTEVDRKINAASKAVLVRVQDYMTKQVAPQIQRAVDWMNYNTQDAEQFTRDYQTSVAKSSSDMYSNAASTTSFQPGKTFFNDKDD